MRQRLFGRGFVALLGLGLGACVEGGGDVREGPIGGTTSALSGTSLGYGGRDDTVDLATANVVVELTKDGDKKCSGTLISPLVVLTAGHCILGNNQTGFRDALGPTPLVNAGAPRPELVDVTDLVAVSSVTKLGRATGGAELGQDIALVFMDEAALQANVDSARGTGSFAHESVFWNTLLEIRSERPSFAVPPSTVNGSLYGFREPIGVAGFGGSEVRQVAFFAELELTRGADTWQQSQGSFKTPTVNVREVGGDSGGPLFHGTLRTADTRSVRRSIGQRCQQRRQQPDHELLGGHHAARDRSVDS